ncbi:tetratricopeptide repeat protein [Turneriella parva]|uniref:tetratricopeptide repeat protein n=1 Tax=Turneriella parva TaxID=29510 RepID=UPI00145EA760|nr:tetratricopeptide repeat protein [Turneriella parva]
MVRSLPFGGAKSRLPGFRRIRTLIIVAAIVLTAGLGYAVFYPTLGIRQNLAEEEFQKAWLLYQDRKYDAAIEKFSQALLINPQFHWARRFLAQAYFMSGQTSEAIEEFETLARAMPHDMTLRNRLEALNLGEAAQGDGTTEFLRIVPRTQGYRYNRPTFVGALQSDQMAVLSLGNFEIGNMVSFSAQGEPVENRHRVSGRLNYPMAFAQSDSEIWITDFRDDRIHRLDKNGKRYLAYLFNPDAVGSTGEGELQFRAPAGICHRAGEFIVADSGNNRLQRVDESGKFIAFISRPEDSDALQTPFGLWCNEESIWLTESGAGRVTQLDRYGNVVKEFSPPELKKPRHITWDEDQQLFTIADESSGILFMNPAGSIVRKTTGYNSPTGKFVTFARPYAATYDAFRNLYVADYGSSEVVQFAPVSEKFGQLYMQVEKVNAARFPSVGVYVTVSASPLTMGKSALPQYLTELRPEDFKIFENDAPVGNLGTQYLGQFDQVLQAAIVISRSKRMQEYETQIPWVLDHLLTKIREKDRYRIMSHGSDVRTESDFISSRLKILQSVKMALAENQLSEQTVGSMSSAIYDAVGELISREGKRAVIYLTDGSADDDALTPYSKDRLVDYARANHIPVHVISFEHPQSAAVAGAREALQDLAKRTGGSYHRALEIDPNIDAILRGQKEVRYVLSYQSFARKQMRGQYVDLRVSARFRERRGLDLSGYFIP